MQDTTLWDCSCRVRSLAAEEQVRDAATHRGKRLFDLWRTGLGVAADSSQLPGWEKCKQIRAQRPNEVIALRSQLVW